MSRGMHFCSILRAETRPSRKSRTMSTRTYPVIGLSAALLLAFGCDDGGDAPAEGAPPAQATALRLSFEAPVEGVVCNGRLLPCVAADGRCTVDVDANRQGWPDTAVLCQGVIEGELFAPVVPLVFKDGLPIWTPNLNAAGEVLANAHATALGVAFLSPYLTALFPETARAILAQSSQSPYLADLEAAVAASDPDAVADALPRLVADVLSQTTVEQPLTDASRSLGMDHIEVVQTSGYVTMDSRLGTPVDHICVIWALQACVPESEVALAQAHPSDYYEKTYIGRTFVSAKSYFNLQALAKAALQTLLPNIVSGPDLETFRLEPGRVHDIQCYSGGLGLLDEQDAANDRVLVAAEPEGSYYVNFARVANLISLAIDTLRLFVDFDAFGEKEDIAKAVAICVEEALGPTLALVDGGTREEWFDLLKLVQVCAVKRLGVILAKRGLHALAVWIFDFAAGGGGGWVGKAARAGMIIDRIVGMTLRSSPIQRQLLAYQVDFDACAPCAPECADSGARACADPGHHQTCVADAEGCLVWSAPAACPLDSVCAGAGECEACGDLGERCCADDVCAAGHRCAGGACVLGCRDECPANGVVECAHRGARRVCGEHDGDECLEWGPADLCADGEVCEDGACAPPACDDDCPAQAVQCAPEGEAVQRCGECDADPCRDWCPDEACAEDFVCLGAACECDERNEDLPGVLPGARLADLDDSGVSHVVRNSLWPERDVDIISAYVADTAGDTLRPRADVDEVAVGVTYDVCIAFACDPAVNDGSPTSVDCGDAIRTTRDGDPACCVLAQQGPSTVSMDINCTVGGLRDDSGTARVYLEATRGSQCAPPVRLTLTGGED